MSTVELTSEIPLCRADNLRSNLQRIFAAGGIQRKVAKDAGIHHVYLAKLLNGTASNPGIKIIEALSIALEIPVETLISANPADVDLRISPRKS
jgi:transcriptional regulator with XRE-family HTH domain